MIKEEPNKIIVKLREDEQMTSNAKLFGIGPKMGHEKDYQFDGEFEINSYQADMLLAAKRFILLLNKDIAGIPYVYIPLTIFRLGGQSEFVAGGNWSKAGIQVYADSYYFQLTDDNDEFETIEWSVVLQDTHLYALLMRTNFVG